MAVAAFLVATLRRSHPFIGIAMYNLLWRDAFCLTRTANDWNVLFYHYGIALCAIASVERMPTSQPPTQHTGTSVIIRGLAVNTLSGI